MAANMKGAIKKAKNTVEVNTYGQINLATSETGTRIKFKVKESILGKMAGSTLVIGLKILCTEWASTPGQTAVNMMVSIKMIKSMVLAPTLGLTEGNIMANGKTDSSME